MKWLIPNTIYVTLHGSQAYGIANEFSDVDIKGIVIPPKEVEHNLFNRFEQHENSSLIEESLKHLKNPKNPKFESVIYSLKKFMILASQVNPNIIELLYTHPTEHFISNPPIDKLMENRDLFLSSKAKYTFSGYSAAQLAKMQRHRKWIVLGDLKEPKREDFGLSAARPRQLDEVFRYIKSEIEKWNLSKFPMEEMERNELKETIWDLIYNLSKLKIGWDDCPKIYEAGLVQKISTEYNLKDEIVDLLNRERKYKKEKEQYTSWLNWKKNRNPERYKLEEKCGFDSKHAAHLVRLLRMGNEILTRREVIVKRPDREELLLIKNGGWSYEKIIEYSEEMNRKLDENYKTTTLKKSVDYEKINKLYNELYEEYWHNKI